MKLAALILCIMWPVGAVAGTLEFVSPDHSDGLHFSIYPADRPASVPVANLPTGQPVDLAAGQYVYGIDSFAWRSAPFDIDDDETKAIRLGAVRIEAPGNAHGQYGLFDAEDGKLLAPLSVPATVHVPEGRYILRRDLAETGQKLEVETGESTVVSLGALGFDGPGLPPGQIAYLADQNSLQIAATVASFGSPVALPAGRYLVAASAQVPVTNIVINGGEISVLAAPVLRWADAQRDGENLTLIAPDGEAAITLTSGEFAEIVAFGFDAVDIKSGTASLGRIQLPSGETSVLWRLKDGRMPIFDGLPLALVSDGPLLVARGATVRLASDVAEVASMQISLRQDERIIDLGTHRLGPGAAYADIKVPDDLADTPAIQFSISGPRGAAMTGHTEPLQVHRKLSTGVEGLEISVTSETTIGLKWTHPTNAEFDGVNVFRGEDARPVNGSRAVTGDQFADIGLSAGRDYVYRVCPIDVMGFLGPCKIIEARTDEP